MTDKTEPKMTNFLRGRKPEKHTRRIWVGWKMKGFQWELQNKNNTDLIKHTKQKLTNRISESSNGDCATIRYNIKGDIIGEFIYYGSFYRKYVSASLYLLEYDSIDCNNELYYLCV